MDDWLVGLVLFLRGGRYGAKVGDLKGLLGNFEGLGGRVRYLRTFAVGSPGS